MGQQTEVEIYTDGACKGNPGPGGYGVILRYRDYRKELSGGYRRTTNNRMEILAAIRGLEALKRACTVTLYSDSRYLVDCMEKGWARRWRARNWMRTKQEAAKNPDLLGRLLDLCEQHRVCFRWVRGHAGHAENERCDRLATEALKRKDLAEDEGYTRASGGGAASAWRNP